GHRIDLHVADDGHTRAAVTVELQRQQLCRALVTVDDSQHVPRVDGDGLRRAAAVEDGGHGALAAEAAGDTFARALAALHDDLRRVHLRLLYEQGRNRLFIVYPSNGLTEQRRHRQHGDAADRALLRGYRDRIR